MFAFLFCMLFSILNFLCFGIFCVFFPLLYWAVFFFRILYNFTDHYQLVETQLHYINIISEVMQLHAWRLLPLFLENHSV